MSLERQGPAIRGIKYDTGTAYAPGVDSRPDWSPEGPHHHMSTIRSELHANAVNVFGSDPDRLLAANNTALDCGLQVRVQPLLPDGIIDWYATDGPCVVGEHRRDETLQATYLAELLDLYTAAGIDGAFVFGYSEPLYPRSSDPRRDLDIASFGIVAVETTTSDDCLAYTETLKEAFHELARRYRAAADAD